MSSLRDEAKFYFDDFQDAIGWMLVWKEGRSWNIERMYETEYEETNRLLRIPAHWTISEDNKAEIERVLAIDPNAVLINGYYYNIGSLEEMTLTSLVDGIRFQYRNSYGELRDIVDSAKVVA